MTEKAEDQTDDTAETTAIQKVTPGRSFDAKAIVNNQEIWIETWNGDRINATITGVRSLVPAAELCSDVEVAAYLVYCQTHGYNPFDRSVHILKVRPKPGRPAPPVAFQVSYLQFIDRAQRHASFDGVEAGVVWWDGKQSVLGTPCQFPQDSQHRVIGTWATVHRTDRKIAVHVQVPIAEVPNQSSPIRQQMPLTMAVKNALSRALRQAFPEEIGSATTDAEPFASPSFGPSALDMPRRKDLPQGPPARTYDPVEHGHPVLDGPEIPGIEPVIPPYEETSGGSQELPEPPEGSMTPPDPGPEPEEAPSVGSLLDKLGKRIEAVAKRTVAGRGRSVGLINRMVCGNIAKTLAAKMWDGKPDDYSQPESWTVDMVTALLEEIDGNGLDADMILEIAEPKSEKPAAKAKPTPPKGDPPAGPLLADAGTA